MPWRPWPTGTSPSACVLRTSHDEIGGLAQSFNFMAEALEREEALRKHLTSNIAHELRTPLSIMKANVEAMLDGVIDDHEQGIKNIRTEVEKLILLVQGIEDITKAEASFFTKKDYVELVSRRLSGYHLQKNGSPRSGKKPAVTYRGEGQPPCAYRRGQTRTYPSEHPFECDKEHLCGQCQHRLR